MLYRTIAMRLLETHPAYPQLCQQHKALETMDSLAAELKASHESHKAALTKANPNASPEQIASEAAEMAMADLEAYFQASYPSPQDGDQSSPLQ